jgi:adenylate kinase family enzyme
MNKRIHIFGASGSGTTTLGRTLSEPLNIPHFDTDDYFWMKTPTPYTVKREVPERSKLLESDLVQFPEWVLSGSLCGWGDFATSLFGLVVFLWIPGEVRMRRLREREIDRYGVDAISPGGWFYDHHSEFIAWASKYDTAGVDMRSKSLHEQWMKKLPCRLLMIEGTYSIEELSAKVEHELNIMEHN